MELPSESEEEVEQVPNGSSDAGHVAPAETAEPAEAAEPVETAELTQTPEPTEVPAEEAAEPQPGEAVAKVF